MLSDRKCNCCKAKSDEEKQHFFLGGIFLSIFMVVLAFHYDIWRFC